MSWAELLLNIQDVNGNTMIQYVPRDIDREVYQMGVDKINKGAQNIYITL